RSSRQFLCLCEARLALRNVERSDGSETRALALSRWRLTVALRRSTRPVEGSEREVARTT
ncbi:MAG: hypothetical protein WKF54_14790, partial [Nocardioidaceae bacterium]